MLAAAARASAPDAPITVTGHAWAPFISPMGEPFRARSVSDDTLALWFGQADRNRDGVLTLDEMRADADRFFATLDSDRNGEIEPEELIRYEWEIAPDIQVNSRVKRAPGETVAKPRKASTQDSDGDFHRRRAAVTLGGLQGGARYALLNIPEPVAAADLDFNRGITLNEFRQAATARFQLLDSGRNGRLTLPDLQARRFALRGSKARKGAPDTRNGTPLPPGN
jgi:Ca2+-binding EF-hand superfamily protein